MARLFTAEIVQQFRNLLDRLAEGVEYSDLLEHSGGQTWDELTMNYLEALGSRVEGHLRNSC